MKKFLENYLAHKDELINLLVAEVGKPIAQVTGCVVSTADLIEEFIEQSRSLGGETLAVANRTDVANNLNITVREPLGIVVSILSFNYPIDQITHKAIPALLMGNVVIVKPASETPLANIRYVELMLESGVPCNVVQLVTGSGSKVGKWLTDDERVSVVTMTGSNGVGAEISKSSTPHLHHVMLELGGNSPYIILEDVDIDAVVAVSVFGRTLNSGQVCSAYKRFIVHNSVKQDYIDKLVASLKTKKLGDSANWDTDCGSAVSVKAAKEIEEQINHTIEQGAKLIYGGKRFNETFIELTVLEATLDMDISCDLEIFGPVWPVIGFDIVDEAIEIANNTKYGLSVGVSGSDMATMLKVIKAMQSGSCIINGSTCYRAVD